MGRRHDQSRVLSAQLEGARLRITDLERRRDLSATERSHWLSDAHARVVNLEAEIAGRAAAGRAAAQLNR